jgi:hypothetical protein
LRSAVIDIGARKFPARRPRHLITLFTAFICAAVSRRRRFVVLVRSARIVVTVAAVVAASVGATYWAATQGWFEPQGQGEARQEQAPPPQRPMAPPPERPDGPSPFGGLREALNPNWVEARAPFAPQEPPAAEPPPLPSDPPAPLDFDVPIPAPRPPNLVREETIPLPPIRPRDLPAVVAALTPPNAPAPETAGPQPAAYAPGGLAPPDEKPPLTPLPEPSGDFRRGAQVFVRIYKKESQLELWMRKGGRYALYKTFPICAWSGKLGPKIKAGRPSGAGRLLQRLGAPAEPELRNIISPSTSAIPNAL